MTKLRLKIAVLALAAVFSLGAVAYGATFTSAKTNSATAELLSTPNASLFDLALGFRENATDTIDETNAAFAHSTCDGCRTVAIAFQVVIVQSASPSQITPTNVAVALNENCTGCSSLALAHQFVVGRGGPARITSDGRKRLFAVGDDLLAIERNYQALTDAEIQSRVDADAAKVRSILSTELVPLHSGGPKPGFEDDRSIDRGV
ncbi:MAG: putative peptide zinc metalloprotease protein [Solirubrobacteraceae bacterium]|nr:putative peptide zinc metalloprotease protein [Solirubrobacteraceae bacterium]